MRSKRLALLALAVGLAWAAQALAQDRAPRKIQPAPRRAPPTQEQLQERYQETLKADWFAGYGWTDDLKAASERARSEDKLLVAYFTRSYSP